MCTVPQPNYEKSRSWSSRCDKQSTDPQVVPIRTCKGLDECHDAIGENGASSNTPHRVDIEEKTRHKQDRGKEKWSRKTKEVSRQRLPHEGDQLKSWLNCSASTRLCYKLSNITTMRVMPHEYMLWLAYKPHLEWCTIVCDLENTMSEAMVVRICQS